MQLMRKAATTHRHFVFGAIRMARQADNAERRLPLLYQRRDRRKFGIVGGGIDNRQFLRLPYPGIADRNAYAFQAKIKSKYGFH